MTRVMMDEKLKQMENELKHLRKELERMKKESSNQFERQDTDCYLTEVYN
ncbi:hypothetical protein [Brevibacillus dissolubilis]|nr:hypothetical protein [Brevibacillus dissolubilis]